MFLLEAIKSFLDDQRINSKKNTVNNYEIILATAISSPLILKRY
jgi:hypothetical protein